VATNLDTILAALCTAVEGITPTALPSVTFKRWRGPGWLGEVTKPQPAMRTFQFQVTADGTPRSMNAPSSTASQWVRGTLTLVVAYDFKLPRAFDTSGLGPSFESANDATELWAALVLGNPVSSSTYHLKHLVPNRPWQRVGGSFSRFAWDFEWARG
jgi:hypothetical protein